MPNQSSNRYMVVQGTNGGVTKLGLMASIGGGLLVGTAAFVGGLIAPTVASVPGALEAAQAQWQLIPLGQPPRHHGSWIRLVTYSSF